MPTLVHAIGTAVPPVELRQVEIRDRLAGQPDLSGRLRRLIDVAFDASAIETRHTVLRELGSDGQHHAALLFDPASGAVLPAGTAARNELFRAEAPELAFRASASALNQADAVEAADVTHLITVSCTGFMAPGLDQQLVVRLGLDLSVERFHLGFMGCHAAFPALRAAAAFCAARPDAVVLVVCVELCTLHLQPSVDTDAVLAASLFADGAAAAVISARPVATGTQVFELDPAHLRTTLLDAGEADMTWTVGDRGFAMVLSSYVPKLLGQHLEKAVAPLFDAHPDLAGHPFATVQRWAVHPGGRSILDKVQGSLDLDDAQLRESRAVLAAYGNMSSATVLFVLRELLTGPAPVGGAEQVAALAFGPGLTVESGLLTLRVAG